MFLNRYINFFTEYLELFLFPVLCQEFLYQDRLHTVLYAQQKGSAVCYLAMLGSKIEVTSSWMSG
jgi:hypothetical protein